MTSKLNALTMNQILFCDSMRPIARLSIFHIVGYLCSIYFNLGKNKIVAKTDTLVQSTDIPSKMGLSDAARKSIVACVSDFASKGVKPDYGMISINLPKTI